MDALISELTAIPDTNGGVLVSWKADEHPDVGSFLVWRLSAPVLLATLPVDAMDEDGFYRFYDPSLPEGTHHYVIQVRAHGSSVTVFDEGNSVASNGVRRVFVVDLGCLESESDLDGDGLCDRVERELGTSVLLDDTDGDGLTDFEELRGTRAQDGVPSNPFSRDTNGDGIDDAESVSRGINPTAVDASAANAGWSGLKVALVIGAALVVAVAALALFGRKKPGA